MAQAAKFLAHLLQFHPKRIETHICAAEIYLRKKKPLLVLRALKHGYSIDGSNPDLHVLSVRYLQLIATNTDNVNPVVDAVIKEETQALFSSIDPLQHNNAFLEKHSTSALHIVAYAKASQTLQEGKEKAIALLSKVDPTSDLSISLKTSIVVHEALLKTGSAEKAEAYKNKCRTRFKYSTYFHGKDVNNNLVIRSLKSSEETNQV